MQKSGRIGRVLRRAYRVLTTDPAGGGMSEVTAKIDETELLIEKIERELAAIEAIQGRTNREAA